MKNGNNKYEALSTREECNSTIRHLESMMEIIENFENFNNLADLLNEYISNKKIERYQIKPIINTLLIDKYKYSFSSYNLEKSIVNFEKLVKIFTSWNAIDLVFIYFHPELGVLPINPKKREHWETAQWLKKSELISIFVGEFQETGDKKLYGDIIEKIIKLLKGSRVDIPPSFKKGKFKLKKIIKKTDVKVPAKKKKEIKNVRSKSQKKAQENVKLGSDIQTPRMYGITVTNGAFHNGNVEAWKKIISSYNYVYPGLQVIIYYDGERINNINSLFQWGKVKRGSVILMSVIGEDLQEVAVLRRYLAEGASPRFKRFIQGSPNTLLRIFGNKGKK